MPKQQFFIFLLFILTACNSGDDKTTTEKEPVSGGKLSHKKAKELIQGEIDRTKNDVGGSKKDIKEFTIHTITEKDSIYTIKYIWSGEMHQPSVPPLEGEVYQGSYAVKSDTAELKVLRKDNRWEIIK